MAKSANIKMHILYCKHSDVEYLSGDITDYLCNTVNQVTPLEAIGAQKDRGVWQGRQTGGGLGGLNPP